MFSHFQTCRYSSVKGVPRRLWQLGLQDAHGQAVFSRARWPDRLLPLQTAGAVTFKQIGLLKTTPSTLTWRAERYSFSSITL